MDHLRDLLRMGTRNVGRNRRRSVIAAAMTGIAVGCIVFFEGYTQGIENLMVRGAVESLTGALQVQRRGYAEAQDLAPLHLDLPQEGGLLTAVQGTPNVKAVTPRLRFTAQLSNGERSSVVLGLGLAPKTEAQVCPLGIGVVRDAPGSFNSLLSGQPLDASAPDGVLIAADLARGLGLEVGAPVTLLAQTRNGSLDTADATVRGVFRLDDPMSNKLLVLVGLDLAQRLLHMPDRATALAVAVHDEERLDETRAGLDRALAGVHGVDAQAHPWTELTPYLRDVIVLQRDIFNVVLVVVLLLVAAGVVNTTLMSVHERRREIGSLMAMGFRRRSIVMLFLIEAAALASLASLAGAGLGTGLVVALQHTGIGFPIPSGTVLLVYPEVRSAHLLLAVGATSLVALAAGLWPAYTASRLHPVEALRST